MRVHPDWTRSARIALVAVVTLYGALLRLDAISQEFDPVTQPRWLHRLEIARNGPSALRPAGMHWDLYPRFQHKDGPPSQYRSDPYTYLQYAREMRSFYAAHRREPLFPFATKVWLWLLHDHDSAVSFASAAFSVLAILLTVVLGVEAFSYGTGLAAAALWAIEFDVVTGGTEGWRDEAFTCAVLLVSWMLLRFVRLPSTRHAVLLGAAAAAACLVRITALSFLLPAFVWVLLSAGRGWRVRLKPLAVATLILVALIGPFLFNCWRAFGDPFYAINVHANVYRETEGQASGDASTREYIASHLRDRPVETIDTIVLGLTTYPFNKKWGGFDVWHPALGPALALLSLIGLLLIAGTAAGRLLLVVLAASLVPYAVTWRLIGDWRFTEHAYPFFLLAACGGPVLLVRAIKTRRGWLSDRQRLRHAALAWGGGLALLLIVWLVFTRVTPGLVFQGFVRAGEPATIMAGDRDAAFFGDGWRRAVKSGAIPTRIAEGSRATMLVPLPVAAVYDVLLRVDPSTEPLRPGMVPARIQLLLNGRFIAACDPGSTPERVGICRLVLPADSVRPGTNRLLMVTDQPNGFRLWYLRVTKRSS